MMPCFVAAARSALYEPDDFVRERNKDCVLQTLSKEILSPFFDLHSYNAHTHERRRERERDATCPNGLPEFNKKLVHKGNLKKYGVLPVCKAQFLLSGCL